MSENILNVESLTTGEARIIGDAWFKVLSPKAPYPITPFSAQLKCDCCGDFTTIFRRTLPASRS